MFFCLSCNLCASFSLLDNFWTLENCNCTPEILNTARYFCVWNCDLRSNKKSRARNRRNANRRSFYWDGWPHTRQRHSFFHPHCMVSVPYSSLNFYLTLVIQSRDLFFRLVSFSWKRQDHCSCCQYPTLVRLLSILYIYTLLRKVNGWNILK